ncbi:alkylmercury lyase family protein [Clostridium tagluense]|nr:alkylmercury lyase family protein [Clostridium tagluense]
MNFFCTKKHYDTWVNKMQIPEEDIFCLDIQEAILVAKMIFNSNFSKDFPYANV